MIAFSCPTCSKQCEAPDELAGEEASCGQCQTHFLVPSTSYDWQDESKRKSPFYWPILIAVIVAIHIGIYYGAILLWQMSRSGELVAFGAGIAMTFMGLIAIIAVFGVRSRRI